VRQLLDRAVLVLTQAQRAHDASSRWAGSVAKCRASRYPRHVLAHRCHASYGGRIMSSFRRLIADLPRAFWILFAGTVVNRTGSFVLLFLVVYLIRVRGFSIAEAGAVAALWGVGVAIVGPMGGFVADRIGRRATMMFALGVGGAAMIGLG